MRSVACTTPLSVPLIETRSTWISASTSAESPRISSLPEGILPSNFPSIRKVSSNVSSPFRWLPRSRNPLSVAPSPRGFMRAPFGSLPLVLHHALEEPDQLLLGPEEELDPPPPPAADDPDLRLKAAGQFLLGVACERVPAFLPLQLVAGSHARRPFLRLADRERTADDLFGEELLIVGGGESEKGLGVARGELSGADPVPDL